MAIELKRHLFTVDEYFQMVETGILEKDDHVELIEGEIVEMAPIGSYHAGVLNRLAAAFASITGTDAVLSYQNPVRLGERSAPQPDVAVLKLRADFYSESHPNPDEVYLLIEIADTTVLADQRVKAPLYAEAGIAEYWIINLTNRSIEIHRRPSAAGYLENSIAVPGEKVSLEALPGLAIAVDHILG